MDNKNKKDMSVDDLVKQLKLVLEINDDEDEKQPDIKHTEPDFEESEAETTTSHLTVENAETISDKVKLLDKFFDEEENKKNKKKNKKLREKKEKKKKHDKDDDDMVIRTYDNNENEIFPQSDKNDGLSDAQLSSFADEIGDMFTDDAPATAAEPAKAEETKPDEKSTEEIKQEDKPAEKTKQEEITIPLEEIIKAAVSAPATEKNDGPELHTEFITTVPDEPEENEAEPDDGIISPFVTNAAATEAVTEDGGETKKFDYAGEEEATTVIPDATVILPDKTEVIDETAVLPDETQIITDNTTVISDETAVIPDETAVIPDKTAVIPDATAVITETKPVIEEPDNTDIDDFNVFFEDRHPESKDGYTASEEAIMDAFGERQEKPAKNPVKNKADFSSAEIEDEVEEEKPVVRNYDEFTAYDQRKTFLEAFKKKFSLTKTSLVLSSIFAILVFAYEILSFFGDKFPHFCSPVTNPSVFILIDLQLFAICAIFAVSHIISGIKGIFSGKADICSLGALCVIITFVYGIISAVAGNPVMHPVMSASALCVVLMLAARYRCVKRDTLNFRIISGGQSKPKFVMETYTPGKNSAEQKEFYDYVPENAPMLRVSKTNFVRGFFGSNMKPSSSKGYINLMFPVIALIFAAVLALVLILKKDISEAVNAAYTATALCMPAAVFTAITLPSYSGAKKTYADDSCVISESAAEQYADASVVTFEDTDVFPPALDKITSVRLYNDSRMDHIMYVLTSLFRKIGGPLLSICENAAKEYNEFSNNVSIDNAVENGIEATVDAQKVFLGSALYMGSKLDPKYCTDDKQYENNDKSRIMYMIINDVVTAKFYIEYEMDKDFVSVIKQLSTSTRCVAIRTLDPNIDTKLIRSYLDTDIYHCRILRTRENERRTKVSKASKGAVVSRNSIKALLRSLMLCDKMVYSAKINMIICFLSVIIGLIFSVFMIFTHTFTSINALHVIGYQLLLCIVIRLVTKINV